MSNSKIYLGSTNLGTGKIRLGANDVSAIYLGTSLLYPPSAPTGNYLCFTANTANCTVGMRHYGTNQTTTQPAMYYSTDQTNWTLWDYSNITLANVGDKVYFYGENPNGFSYSQSNYSKFSIPDGRCDVSGNIMSLIDETCPSTIPNTYCFINLFSGISIVSAANLSLPATTLTDYCYHSMFYVCQQLTTGPSVLPATSIPDSAYEYMFYGCIGLIAAPVIQAQVAGGGSCQYMFKNCSSLTTVQSIPSILNGGSTCYQMFMGCTSLVNLQHLRITTISSQSCVGMFKNCTALTTSPILEDETLIASCYEEMFYGCLSLNSVTCLATDITAYNSTNNWLYGVSATGTFTKELNMSSWTTGVSGIPTGWTVDDYYDCSNWEGDGFNSYEDCDCQVNGNCGEEEPEEEEQEP